VGLDAALRGAGHVPRALPAACRPSNRASSLSACRRITEPGVARPRRRAPACAASSVGSKTRAPDRCRRGSCSRCMTASADPGTLPRRRVHQSSNPTSRRGYPPRPCRAPSGLRCTFARAASTRARRLVTVRDPVSTPSPISTCGMTSRANRPSRSVRMIGRRAPRASRSGHRFRRTRRLPREACVRIRCAVPGYAGRRVSVPGGAGGSATPGLGAGPVSAFDLARKALRGDAELARSIGPSRAVLESAGDPTGTAALFNELYFLFDGGASGRPASRTPGVGAGRSGRFALLDARTPVLYSVMSPGTSPRLRDRLLFPELSSRHPGPPGRGAVTTRNIVTIRSSGIGSPRNLA